LSQTIRNSKHWAPKVQSYAMSQSLIKAFAFSSLSLEPVCRALDTSNVAHF